MTEPDNPFERFTSGGASPHQLRMLAEAIKQAPLLQSRVSEAMRSKDLTSITAHDNAHDSARGFYDGWHREISFNRDILDARINERGVDAVVDVASHEIEHALRRGEMNQFAHAIELQAYALSDQPGPQDGTGLMRAYIAKGREQEALAELAGFNGLADRMRAERKGPVQEERLAERLVPNSSCVEQGPSQ